MKCSWVVAMGRSEVQTRVVKWSEVELGVVKVLVTVCLPLIEDIQIIRNLLLIWLFRLPHSFLFFRSYFVSLYIGLYVLRASV